MRKLLLALLLLGAGAPAVAADDQNTYVVYMTITCEAFTAARWDQQGVRYKQIEAWISGYVTAYNGWQVDTHDILGGTNVPTAESWVENYCRSHPLDNLSNAMEGLVQELQPQRQRTAVDFGR
jgi:hypothetical protein